MNSFPIVTFWAFGLYSLIYCFISRVLGCSFRLSHRLGIHLIQKLLQIIGLET